MMNTEFITKKNESNGFTIILENESIHIKD